MAGRPNLESGIWNLESSEQFEPLERFEQLEHLSHPEVMNMYGWRARIGHVAPSRGDTLVYEFYKMFPEGFMMLNTTGTVRQLVDGDFEKQLSRIEEAVQDLVDNNCDAIIFSGSPLFTRLPFGADRELGKKLSDKFGVPVAAGLTAEVEALKAMKCQKLVVGTPYEEEINQRLKRHLV
jgi:maleate isomerase